ncbi:hypothetical protein E1264_06900 [Actinomadura sp. KC216]|uniref:hypothetical protein n=1 Tax=Actinomadura sp. KC216 TaxID=2530370 RepID=UPI0010486EAE|nr:hypothetical protein [Actinomadura sp. KC216]TDB89825.1 hypothetical protein E1264_06900 [Actinomadura sp. KC216]
MPTRSGTTEHDNTTKHDAHVSPPGPPRSQPDRNRTPSSPPRPRGPRPRLSAATRGAPYLRATRWLRATALLAALTAATIAAGGLALTAIATGMFALAYLLQGTWLTALALFTGHVLATGALMLLAGLAKRRTRRHRARLAAAVITRWGHLTVRRADDRRTESRPASRHLNAPGQR